MCATIQNAFHVLYYVDTIFNFNFLPLQTTNDIIDFIPFIIFFPLQIYATKSFYNLDNFHDADRVLMSNIDKFCNFLYSSFYIVFVITGYANRNNLKIVLNKLLNIQVTTDVFATDRRNNMVAGLMIFVTVITLQFFDYLYFSQFNETSTNVFVLFFSVMETYLTMHIFCICIYAHTFKKLFRFLNLKIVSLNCANDSLWSELSALHMCLKHLMAETFQIFTVQILLHIFLSFAYLIDDIGYFVLLVQDPKFNISITIVSFTKWITTAFFKGLVIVKYFNAAEIEANKSPLLFHEVWNKYANNMKCQRQVINLKLISLQMKNNAVRLKVFGLFRLDYTLPQSMLASVTTYSVILVQMEYAINTNHK